MAQQLTLGDLIYSLSFSNEQQFIQTIESTFDKAERGAAASGKKAGQGFFSNLKSSLNPASIRSSLSNMFSGAPARAGAEGAGAGRSFAAGVSGAVARVRAQLGSSFGGAEPQARAAGAKAGAAYTQGFRGVFSGAALGGFLGGIYAGLFVQATNAIGDFTRELRVRSNEIQTENIKISQVFAQTEGDIRGWAESVRRDLGLSTQQVTSLAAATQDLLVPMGFQRDRATELTKETLNVAAALSQWDSAQRDSAEIAAILTKAYLGEREQLKTLGISISEADVKARLAAAGQEKLTGQALQQAKALATLELITERSADAQEAFANSADSAGRRMNEARSRIAEARDELAQQFAPAAGEIAVAALTLLGNVLESVANLFEQTETNVDNTGAALQDLPVKGAGALTLFYKLQAAANIAGASLDILNLKFSLMGQRANEGVRAAVAALNDFAVNQIPAPLKRLLGLEDIQFGGGGGGGGGRNVDGLSGLENQLAEAEARLTQAFVAYDSAGAKATETASNFSSSVRGAADSQASFASSTDGATDAIGRQAGAMKDMFTEYVDGQSEAFRLAKLKRDADLIDQETYVQQVQTLLNSLINEYQYVQSEAIAGNITAELANQRAAALLSLQNQLQSTIDALTQADGLIDEARRVSADAGRLKLEREQGFLEAQEYEARLEAHLRRVDGMLLRVATAEEQVAVLNARAQLLQALDDLGVPLDVTPEVTVKPKVKIAEPEVVADVAPEVQIIGQKFDTSTGTWVPAGPVPTVEVTPEVNILPEPTVDVVPEVQIIGQRFDTSTGYWVPVGPVPTVEVKPKVNIIPEVTADVVDAVSIPLAGVTAEVDAAYAELLKTVQGRGELADFLQLQRQIGRASRDEVAQGLEAQREALIALLASVEVGSDTYKAFAEQLAGVLEALDEIEQKTPEEIRIAAEMDALEAEIKDVALSFPKAIVSGIGSGDIGGALRDAMGGAVTFFTDKLIENILGPIAEELARVAAQKLAVSAAGNAASGAASSAGSAVAAGAAGGPAGIALATLALVGGSIISAISGSRSRVQEQRELYGSGGSSTGSSGGGAATINNTANVTVSVTTPGGITDPGTQNEVRALARSSARDLLRELGLIKGSN